MIRMAENAEHPTTKITWVENGILLDMTQGFTFSATITNCRDPRRFIAKTTTINAERDKRPNITVNWAATSELSTLPIGLYSFVLRATNARDSTDYVYKDTLMIEPA